MLRWHFLLPMALLVTVGEGIIQVVHACLSPGVQGASWCKEGVLGAQLWAASWQLSSGWLKVPGPGSCGCLQALGILCSRDSDPIVVHVQEPDSLGILCAPS